MRRSILFALFILSSAPIAHAAAPTTPPYGLPALERGDFNRLAAIAGLPIFWRDDAEAPGTLDATEVATLGVDKVDKWVKKGAFTKAFEKAYRQLVELRRREAVERELAQGRPTLVETDLRSATPEERAVLQSLAKAARQIDTLFEAQLGAKGMAAKAPKDHPASAALIARNHGPWCEAPTTQNDPFCNALPGFPKKVVTAWPPELQADKGFCDKVAAEPNAAELTAPFSVVRQSKKGLVAVGYDKAYRAEMRAVAGTLAATAKLVKSPEEAAFKAYLLAAAKGFDNNDWAPADEAWAAMSADNSRYYLRIAPDETYWDPCGVKAAFHMSFALVDRSSLEWKQKLTTVRSDLEAALADLIGAPYAAREVNFELPEFINIVFNAGDSRASTGATVGQSLPNVGKVAEESRGRTVAMVNIYTDADSMADFQMRDRSLFTDATFAWTSQDPTAERLSTVLHEAAHNLGPHGAFKVDGKSPEEVFGGPTAAILEELKAQTAALYFPAVLVHKGLMSADDQRRLWTGSIAWAFGHIARGMFDGDGAPKTYSQLSAIQLGELMAAGAIRWVEGGDVDPGRFELDYDKLAPAIEALMKAVGRIKATGDVAAAKALIERHTSAEGLVAMHADVITERVLRYPKASFVYGLRAE